MPSLRWTDADPANSADRTVTWKVEQEGRGMRLFLVHEGFDPDDPAQPMARTIMDGGWRTHVMRALGHTMERIKCPTRHICNRRNTPRARASAHASAREQSYDPDQLTAASLATRPPHHRGATCGPRRVQRHDGHGSARGGLAEEPAQQLAGFLRGVRAPAGRGGCGS
ncbi:SRPBCC domain-containing protein [Streptomyces canus]